MSNDSLPPMDSVLREVFRVAYIYRQKYQHPTADPAFWRRAADEMVQIIQHCDGHPFAQAILETCYIDIEREFKANRAQKGDFS